MAKKKKEEPKKNTGNPNVMGLHAEVVDQPITETLENNYMPYAMSVIVSRAIPEIDGFKPSHRKLLYTMYKMGLLNGARTKSANIVGQTMKLNPHGDAAIYETMVRLSTGHEALLTPFVDSKGNFGKVYSRDMSYAASRYTEARLSGICSEIFKDIDKDTVELVDNYDGSMKEPKLLPTTFPNVLVSANSGIAVGMASMICGFNLNEVCKTAIRYLRDPDCDLMETLPAPDFSTGGQIILNREEMERIYNTGKGSFKVRAKWRYLPKENIIEIYEIPYTTTTDIIIDKIVELCKTGKIREINDVRDETDLSGLCIAIDLKRGTDPEKLMGKLFKMTTLQDPFPCNFNILINDYPKVMGIREILGEWTKWRTESIRRRTAFELQKKTEKLHLLQGLGKILLDIDKAISIIRNTEQDKDVVPNLMVGFGIDQAQAEYVAEIKLRNINKEYISNRVAEINDLLEEVEKLREILGSESKIRGLISNELKKVDSTYSIPRKSEIIYSIGEELNIEEEEEPVEDYHVTLFLSQEGYFKKINDQSLRMSGEQKYKENDGLKLTFEAQNRDELLVFTDQQQVYRAKVSDFPDTRASVLGVYLPTVLKMDPGEKVVTMLLAGDYSAFALLCYEDGYVNRVSLKAYEINSRKKLKGAYWGKSPLVDVLSVAEDYDVILCTSDERALIVHTSLIPAKESRAAHGIHVINLRKNAVVNRFVRKESLPLENEAKYRAKKIPSSGSLIKYDQMSLL